MTKRLLAILSLACALVLAAQVATAAEEGGELAPSNANIHDAAALQHGAKLFFNYCAGCHSLKYLRYSRMAEDLGLTKEQVMRDLNFTNARFDDHIVSAMPEEDAAKWFGKAPPDLSLEVRAKGPDWVFNYLKGFYLDPSRPVGWNNTVFPNASMPNVLWSLQGIQKAVEDPHSPEGIKLALVKPGRLTPAQYDEAVSDLTSFLEYASEPAALIRRSMGAWVVLYIGLFTLLAYLLKRQYWKDVH
ncbi:MAG TPA: cytochrome c1 [Rhodanobacteraceae bacterium]|nr:cytochrome c1 [Rhodanobacteraceae bacterium]